MSRSWKKYPFCKDNQRCKKGKRYCNKAVRRAKEVPNGKAYRKIVEPWDYIYDYSHSETWEQYQLWCKQPRWWMEEREPDYWEWFRIYKRK